MIDRSGINNAVSQNTATNSLEIKNQSQSRVKEVSPQCLMDRTLSVFDAARLALTELNMSPLINAVRQLPFSSIPTSFDVTLPKAQNISCVQKTEAPAINIVDCRSNTPFKEVLEFLKTDDGQKWVWSLSDEMAAGRSISMPCMAETMENMRTHIDQWKQLPDISSEDLEGLNKFERQLADCKNNGFEFYRSEQIAHCFTYIHGLMTVKYRPERLSDTDTEKEGLKKLQSDIPKHLLVSDILSLPWQDYQQNEKFWAAQTALKIIVPNSLYQLASSNWVRIISFSPLTVFDFNMSLGLPIAFVGLLDTFAARHDATAFVTTVFPWHDEFHSLLKYQELKEIVRELLYKEKPQLPITKHIKKLLDHIQRAIHSFERRSSKLSPDTYNLFHLMLFDLTHEKNNYPFREIYQNERYYNYITDTCFDNVSQGLNDGQKYDGGTDCEDTKKYRTALSAKDQGIELLTQFIKEFSHSYHEKRPFNWTTEK